MHTTGSGGVDQDSVRNLRIGVSDGRTETIGRVIHRISGSNDT
ncbi:hypothetical protein [Halorubrum laminariae]|uniref:Uncharacterized protein n=1 Tax=Halorubrum laminariae TaxID=1433523 RepID=A0ABD6C4L4_9EURY|nr:hypothetical protein [Halorubrum laminariae]